MIHHSPLNAPPSALLGRETLVAGETQPHVRAVMPGSAGNAAPTVAVQRLRPMLGTWVSIEGVAHARHDALSAVENAYAAIASIERCLHPSGPDSELVRIAQAKRGTRTLVSAATWEVLCFAQRLHRHSAGVFDPCVPQSRAGLEALQLGTDPIDLDPDYEASPGQARPGKLRWVVRHAAVELDCGGFAKGYAIDRAIAALRSAGCVSGLVNAGGDVRNFGPRSDRILFATHRSATAHEPGYVLLHEGALAVSEVDIPGRPPQHRGYYRRSRRTERHRRQSDGNSPGNTASNSSCPPLGSTQAASDQYVPSRTPLLQRRFAAVLARDAMTADALTKCVLLCEPAVTRQLLQHFHAREVLAGG